MLEQRRGLKSVHVLAHLRKDKVSKPILEASSHGEEDSPEWEELQTLENDDEDKKWREEEACPKCGSDRIRHGEGRGIWVCLACDCEWENCSF